MEVYSLYVYGGLIIAAIAISGLSFYIGSVTFTDVDMWGPLICGGISAILLVICACIVPTYSISEKITVYEDSIDLSSITNEDRYCNYIDSNGNTKTQSVDSIILGNETRILKTKIKSSKDLKVLKAINYENIYILEITREDFKKTMAKVEEKTGLKSKLIDSEIASVFGNEYLEIKDKQYELTITNNQSSLTESKSEDGVISVLEYNKLVNQYNELLYNYNKDREIKDTSSYQELNSKLNAKDTELTKVTNELDRVTNEFEELSNTNKELTIEIEELKKQADINIKSIEGQQFMFKCIGIAVILFVIFLGANLVIKAQAKSEINRIKARTESEVHKMVMSDNKYIPSNNEKGD